MLGPEMFFIGLALGLAGGILKIVLSRKLNIEMVVCYLFGGVIFGAGAGVSLLPLTEMNRTYGILIILCGFLGSEVAYRLMSTRT